MNTIPVLCPGDEGELRAHIGEALASGTGLEIVGRGTKRALGHPVTAHHQLSLSRLSGVTLYEPGELILIARAGTPLEEVRALLRTHHQELAFDPPDYTALLAGPQGAWGPQEVKGPKDAQGAPQEGAQESPPANTPPGEMQASFGGTLIANISGSRALKHGLARDFVLGTEVVSGRAETFRAGGRVVKNVTGYDLARAMCASWGTLGVATSFCIKTLPAPEDEVTAMIYGLSDSGAVQMMARAMGSVCDVSGAAHLPSSTGGDIAAGQDGPLTLLRLEGFAGALDARFDTLAGLARRSGDIPHGRIEKCAGDASRQIWAGIRDVRPFCARAGCVWRIACPPASAPRILERLQGVCAFSHYLDWAGGLIWLCVDETENAAHAQITDTACAAALRGILAGGGGGEATLFRAPRAIRARIAVFHPPSPALAALRARIKTQFDPCHILNPGRLGAWLEDTPRTMPGTSTPGTSKISAAAQGPKQGPEQGHTPARGHAQHRRSQ